MSEKIPRPLQPVPDELLQAMEDYLRKAGLPEWIRDMQAYYRRTCNVRRSDITRLLGPTNGEFTIGVDIATCYYERFPEQKPKDPPATEAP